MWIYARPIASRGAPGWSTRFVRFLVFTTSLFAVVLDHVLTAPSDGMAESGRGFWLISNYAPKLAVNRIGQMNRVSVSLPLLG